MFPALTRFGKRVDSPRMVSTGVLLIAVLFTSARQTGSAVLAAEEASHLAREVIENEIRAETNNKNLWSYRELTKRGRKELLLEYCQTEHGTIHRLLAVNGQPLSAKQRRAEDQRIQKLIDSPDALQASQNKESSDAREERRFLKLFPDAFLYRAGGQQGELLKLQFKSNPTFSPSGNEQRVLHSLTGTMVVNVKQRRLASIDGRLMTRVKFWGGILGHLDRGGTFSVVLENVSPGDWEVKSLNVEMDGKALFFKTIAVHEQEAYSDYLPVAPGTTLQQAAERLSKDSNG